MSLKPVLKQNEPIYYATTAELIQFININSDYEWNEICRLTGKHIFNDHGITYYNGPINENSDVVDDFCKEWINKFYEAHPWVKNVMFVFDD